jgi:putative N6-adenine-specific DNA methylase
MAEPDAPKRKRDLPRAERRALARARREAERMSLFVGAAPGLEPLLADEARALGLAGSEPRVVAGGIELDGDRTTLYRANLELGLATQVRLRLGRFHAAHFSELVRRASELPWERWLSPGAHVRFRSTAQRSRLHHTGAIDERVAEAIAARLGGPVIVADGEEDVALVHARFERDEVTLSLDTSGAPLHRRGYRLATAKAPLREDLARALVIISGWDRQSPLVDPMAGSGTIAIEAAMLARGIAPGRARRFAFEDAPTHDAALLARLRDEADERAGFGTHSGRSSDASPRILARDRDEGAVTAARANAERAGVTLEHAVAPLSEPFAVDTDEGALVTNPPWGVRVARDRDLRPLYDRLGALIDALPPRWEVGVVAANAELVRRAHMPLRSALLTDAGGTKVRFYRRAREE